MRVRSTSVAGKKTQVSDIRALIESEAVTIEEIAERRERSIHTLLSFAQGRVPKGADPWPEMVKTSGRTRLYCWTECSNWLDRWSPVGRVT